MRVAEVNGAPLPESERRYFEPRFGQDFGRVRVHTDAAAADAARAVHARAFTIGQDIVFGAAQYAPRTSSGRLLLAHELTHVLQQRGGGAPARIQRAADFGEMYRSRKDSKVHSHLGVEYEKYKAGLSPTEVSSASGAKDMHRLDLSEPLTTEELLAIFTGVADDVDKHRVEKATVDGYVAKLNQVFRTFKIDTVEAQASYLANAWHESDQFRSMTETEKAVKSNQPYQQDPTKVSLEEKWLKDAAAGKKKNIIGYEPGGSINPVNDWQKSFIGRGPIQVTHRHYYVQVIAVMERRAEELEQTDPQSQDARDLREAIDQIKADPRQAANPKYAFMFSAAFMKMPDDKGVRGDVKASRGQVTSWMGLQPADAKKDKLEAYRRAHDVLEAKWLAQNVKYGYEVADDPINTGGLGPEDAAAQVRPGPVRSTLIRHRPDAQPLQRKAMVGPSDDAFEREADAVADRVTREDAPVHAVNPFTTTIRYERGKSEGHGATPLPEDMRSYFEPRLGHNFGKVRIHADGEAGRAAQALQARAYTIGDHITFGAGQFQPHTQEGRHLIAHELAHVVQQHSLGQSTLQRQPGGVVEMKPLTVHSTLQPTKQAVSSLANLRGEGVNPNDPILSRDETTIARNAPDPTRRLPFTVGGWDAQDILGALGQYDTLPGTDSDAIRCVQAVAMASRIVDGPAAVTGFLRAMIVQGMLSQPGKSRQRTATDVLNHVIDRIEMQHATFGDLMWAQEALHDLFYNDVSGTPEQEIRDQMAPAFDLGRSLQRMDVWCDTPEQVMAEADQLQPGEQLLVNTWQVSFNTAFDRLSESDIEVSTGHFTVVNVNGRNVRISRIRTDARPPHTAIDAVRDERSGHQLIIMKDFSSKRLQLYESEITDTGKHLEDLAKDGSNFVRYFQDQPRFEIYNYIEILGKLLPSGLASSG